MQSLSSMSFAEIDQLLFFLLNFATIYPTEFVHYFYYYLMLLLHELFEVDLVVAISINLF